jgi:hypothetical protein
MNSNDVKNRTPLDTDVTRVSDLEPGDRLAPGICLGPFSVIDIVSVKSLTAADNGKFAVTFYNQGTLFLHGDLLVEVVSTP